MHRDRTPTRNALIRCWSTTCVTSMFWAMSFPLTSEQRPRVGDGAVDGGCGYGQRGGQIVSGMRMAVATREIPRLRRKHHLVFGESPHVERLIRARARRENVRSGRMQGLEQ